MNTSWPIPPEIRTLLPFLLLKLPEIAKVNGRLVKLRETVSKVVEDGILSIEDALTILAAYEGAPQTGVPVIDLPPHITPIPVVPPPGPTGVHVQPGTPSDSRIWPHALGFNLDLFDTLDNQTAALPYAIEDAGDFYQLKKTSDTDNLPIHAGAYLHAIYFDENGHPFRFEDLLPPALHLYGTAEWFAREVGGQGRVSRLKVVDGQYVQVDGPGGRIVNWNNQAEAPLEARRTGGMDVPVHFPPEANEAVIEIGFEVFAPTGIVTTKVVRFPKIS